MKKSIFAVLCIWGLSTAAIPALAQDLDPEQCLDCHEPAEDWEGMSVEEIITDAKAPGNKRHKSNLELTDEQLREMISVLRPE